MSRIIYGREVSLTVRRVLVMQAMMVAQFANRMSGPSSFVEDTISRMGERR
jgi:hypothetical protein